MFACVQEGGVTEVIRNTYRSVMDYLVINEKVSITVVNTIVKASCSFSATGTIARLALEGMFAEYRPCGMKHGWMFTIQLRY